MWVCLPVYFSGPAMNHQRVKENVFLPFSLKTLYFLQSLVNTSSESEGGFTLLSCGSWPEHGYSLGCLKVCGPEQVISPLQCFSHLLRGLIIFTWQGGVWIKLDTTLRKIKPPHKTWLLLWLQKKKSFLVDSSSWTGSDQKQQSRGGLLNLLLSVALIRPQLCPFT